MNESETDIRRSLDAGAATVQLDFTEGRLSLKLDPSGGLLRDLFRLKAGNIYLRLASETDLDRVLRITAEEVRDRVLGAAEYIPVERLGTCDDCGFSPFADDTSTSRDTAFAKIAARLEGTRLASEALGT